MKWYEELTGMNKDEILGQMAKPRNTWSMKLLRLVVSVLLADRDSIPYFTTLLDDTGIEVAYRKAIAEKEKER